MTDFATLVYTVAPVGPVSLTKLATALAAISIDYAEIETLAGCVEQSDTTTTAGGDAVRTITYGLTYSCFLPFNGNEALPQNSTTRQYYVVTTTGPNASVGQLLFDNGKGETAPAACTVVAAVTNRTIVAAGAAFAGSSPLTPGHLYTWTGTAWSDEGTTTIGRSGFQNIFPSEAGGPSVENQASAFSSLYTHTFGAALGAVVQAAAPSIS